MTIQFTYRIPWERSHNSPSKKERLAEEAKLQFAAVNFTPISAVSIDYDPEEKMTVIRGYSD